MATNIHKILADDTSNYTLHEIEIKKSIVTDAFFVSAKGLEPLTNGLKGHCSTIELRTQSEKDFTTNPPMRQHIRKVLFRSISEAIILYMTTMQPITAEWMSSAQPAVDALWAGDRLVWLEKRSDRTVFRCQTDSGGDESLNLDQIVVRGGLFYGGGEFCANRERILFAEKSGQLVEYVFASGSTRCLTDHSGKSAAPVLAVDGSYALFVHTDGATDSLRMIRLGDDPAEIVLRDQADFFMQPAIHPDGERIAWIEWNQPQMPWQGCRLMTARLSQTGLDQIQQIAGSDERAVFQPEFSSDGRWLSFIECTGELDSLQVIDLSTGHKRTLLADRTLMEPAWVQGIRVTAWLPDSSGLLQITNDRGVNHLLKIGLDGALADLDLQPYTSFKQIALSPDGSRLSLIASSPRHPSRLVVFSEGSQHIVHHTYAQPVDEDLLPEARPVEWQTDNGRVYGIIYPARGLDQPSELPPAIVQIHSGPTRQTDCGFSADTAFFTSLGLSVLAVNYHGSTGYGRSYCEALNGNWGLLDVEDACSAAQFLIDRELADPARLFIRGTSAGGYTVLNALIRRPGLFRAGICAYAVSNLLSILDETFKYEARYYDSLIGPLPRDHWKYVDWSPVTHADRIRDPLAIFQGGDDFVVPPSQALEIVDALEKNGLPYHYHLFPGEGHGWRKTETLAAYYAETAAFIQKYL